MFGDAFSPLRPASFFEVGFDCPKLKGKHPFQEIQDDAYSVPQTDFLLHEEAFASLHMGWLPEGLYFYCSISIPFKDVFYPEIVRGDSLELFIDTRDIKTASYPTKFCHHFFFLPKEIQSIQAEEITRFRNEDRHDLCDPSDLKVQAQFQKEGYAMKIFIPSQSLYGYDPGECSRIGFSYRVNRTGGAPQNFCVSPEEFAIEQQPFLWGRVRLIDANLSIRPTKGTPG